MADKTHEFSKLAEELIGDLRGVPPQEPRRQVKRPSKPLAEFVEELMVKYHVGRPSVEQLIRDQWVDLVGAANAHHSHPVSVEGKRLVVIAAHSVVRSEILHHRDEILRRLRQIPGCEELRSLSLRAG
ncbi:MAG: hypothetical protein JWM32_1441 [Verrucomicrobia bacterium]|nr:hypothetical protein [Verrucomicrobiota bacterium]